jgi:hypothetical protein
MNNETNLSVRTPTAATFQVPDAFLSLRPGRMSPSLRSTTTGPADAAVRLERLVASCPDVDAFRFDGMTVHAHDGDRIRGVDVHAIVECRSHTFLTNAHVERGEAFWTTALLQAAACQLGFVSMVVAPMAIECSSPRFMTLMAVACRQDVELTALDVDRLSGVFLGRRRPTLGDAYRVLGGASRGRERALASIAQGLLRLAPHSDLTSSVRIEPGPLLDLGRWPSGGATGGIKIGAEIAA